ncbi:MAG: hypothetical protein KAR39_12875, partial [Thermoplasmata archaeon]|nr:hypothetical protein [Thermoplasmata archaeon]
MSEGSIYVDTGYGAQYQKVVVFLLGMVLGSFISVAIGFIIPTFLLVVLVVFSILILGIASKVGMGEPGSTSAGVSSLGLLLLALTVTMMLMRLLAENTPYLSKCVG